MKGRSTIGLSRLTLSLARFLKKASGVVYFEGMLDSIPLGGILEILNRQFSNYGSNKTEGLATT